MSDRTPGDAQDGSETPRGPESPPAPGSPPDLPVDEGEPALREPAAQGPPEVDLGRRRFFRSFGREALQTAAQLVGAATALQRSSLAATTQLLGGGEAAAPADPLARMLGLEDPPAPVSSTFRSPYRYAEAQLTFVDQRRLPDELVEVTCRTGPEVAACIREEIVRGGPVLGQVAAYGLLVAAERTRASTPFIRAATLHGTINALRSSRPASRAIEAAMDRMQAAWLAVGEHVDGDLIANVLRDEAEAIADEAMLDHAAIGRAGAAIMPRPFERHLEILLQGPVGPLAGGALGTALAIIQELQVEGRGVHAWVPEGRPGFHGARITAFELARMDVPHTVIADGASAHLFTRSRVDAVLAGAERIARNGDVSAAIGTYQLAAAAARHGVPVYVCAPLGAVDVATGDGWGFAAEERPVDELADVRGQRVPPGESRLYNPVLDVTPGALVHGFITEQGVLAAPFDVTLAAALARGRGAPGPASPPDADAPGVEPGPDAPASPADPDAPGVEPGAAGGAG